MPRTKAKQPHPGWGGARKGAGRKPVAEKLVRVSVTLSPADHTYLQSAGAGNVSQGVRALVGIHKMAQQGYQA